MWNFACTVPQIHVIYQGRFSRSKINNIHESCEEARRVVDRLHLDYFFIPGQDQSVGGTFKNYINPSIDTFWLADQVVDSQAVFQGI